jgi:uncharacterized protein YjbJ (UPF0337 family)
MRGTIDQIEGWANEAVGAVTDNKRLKNEGRKVCLVKT